MELSTYLQILNRRRWIIVLTVIIVTVLLLIGRALIPTTYTASALLRVEISRTGNPSSAQLLYADRIMNTYVQIANSGPILTELRGKLGIQENQPGEVQVEIIPDTELLRITVKDPNALLARDAANTLAMIMEKENQPRDGKISIIDSAKIPEPPGLKDTALFGLIGLVLGGIFGLGLAFLFENLDTRVQTRSQVEALVRLPVLGEVPIAKKRNKDQFLIDDPEEEDAFRRLSSNLFTILRDTPLKTFLVTSAEPEEGKTTLIASLAVNLAKAGHKVLVIDADFYSPKIHLIFKRNNIKGLSDVLQQPKNLTGAIQFTNIPGVQILTSGLMPAYHIEQFGSERLATIFNQFSASFDFVLVDSPAFLGVSDAAFLATNVDGVILVARMGFAHSNLLQSTYQQMENIKANLIGLVINYSSSTPSGRYKKYIQGKHTKPVVHKGLHEAEKASIPAKQPSVDPQKAALRRPE